jgi:hypothetical protein
MPENIKYAGAPKLTPEEARRTAAIPDYRLDFPQVRLSRAGEEAGHAVGQATKELGATIHTLGASIDSLGKTFEGAGTEMWNRAVGLKQLESETKVNNATIAWEMGQNKKDEDFRSKAGEQANSGALEAHLKSSEEDRQKVRNALSSPYEQKLFDQQTTRPFITSARAAAAHAGSETKKQAQAAIEAKLGIIKNRVASATEDADRRAALQEGAQIFAGERKYAHGHNDDQVHRDYMVWATSGIAAAAERVARDDPTAAMKILEDNKADLDEVDNKIYTAVKEKVQKKWDDNASRVIADSSSGDRDETLEAKENRARQQIKELGRENDQEFVDRTIARLRNKDAVDREKQRQDIQNANQFVDLATHGRQPGQKKPPTTLEEARAVPGFDAEWDRLTPHQQDEWLKTLDVNARGNFPDTPATREIYHSMDGMFDNDKDEMRRRAEADPNWIDKLQIPEVYRNALWSRNSQMRREGIKADEDTPQKRIFDHGKTVGLIPSNISKQKAEKLISYIASEMKAWHQMHPQMVAKKDDWNAMINTARSKAEEPGWLFGTNTVEEYQRDLRKLPDYKAGVEAYKKIHPNASDLEINKALLDAYVLQKLRGEQKPKAVKTTTVTPGG